MQLARQEISIVRTIMLIVVAFGLMLVGAEVFEQLTSCQIGTCEPIHLMPIVVGVALIVLGCLVIQTGDVGVSLDVWVKAGNGVRGWFGRRAYDPKPPTT